MEKGVSRVKSVFLWVSFLLLYGGFGAVCYRLYLRQAIRYPGIMGQYDSDLGAHIGEGLAGTAYSLMERSFGFLMGTLKLNEKSVALWIALITVGTVFVTWKVMCLLYPEANRCVLHLLAFGCMFTMPIFLRSVNPYRYIGLQSGTIWHNSTYIGMRFAAMLVLYLYYRYQETYEKGLSLKHWLLFTASLIFVNLMKPNFILCFAPAMAVMLLTDCIASRGRTLKRQIVFGIPVLISLAVVVYETMVLFSGENDGSSIVLSLAYNLRFWNCHPVAALLQSAAFPLVILAGSLRELKTDRSYRVTWLIWLFGLLEYLFLSETGPRQNHGNFSWGYSFCMFLVFVVCVGRLWTYGKRFLQSCRESGDGWRALFCGRGVYLAFALLLLCWHLVCGLKFSWITYLGGSYLCG